MEELLPAAWRYFWREELPYVASAALGLTLLLWYLRPADRRSLGYTLGLFALCLAGQFAAGVLAARGLSAGAGAAHELFVIGSGVALIRLAGLCLFRALLPSRTSSSSSPMSASPWCACAWPASISPASSPPRR